MEDYYSPDKMEYRLTEFVDYYNSDRYHESLNNVNPADVYFGRNQKIVEKRNILKEKPLITLNIRNG